MKKNICVLLLVAFSGSAFAQFNKQCSYGSMQAGSNVLRLNKAMALKVGQYVTVWLQDPDNSRGTVGPDGAWPNKWYASEADMKADTQQPEGTWAFVEGSPNIYRFNRGAGWWNANNQSFNASFPKALTGAKVVQVSPASGNVYLDKTALRTVNNVRVTADNTQAFIDYIHENKTIDFEALGWGPGDTLWVGSERLYLGYREAAAWNKWQGWRAFDVRILGNGVTIASPPGTVPAMIGWEEGAVRPANNLVRDLKIVQNGNYQGMGLYWPAMPQAGEPMGNPWTLTPGVANWAWGSKAVNVQVYNCASYAFHSGRIDSCTAYAPKTNLNHYNGWGYLSFGDSITNCAFYSDYIVRACEIEAGSNGVVQNFKCVNGTFASNASVDPTFRNIDVHLTKNAAKGNDYLLSVPLFDVNNRLNKGGGTGFLGENITVTYDDYLDEEGGLLTEFMMSAGAEHVTLRNVTVNKLPVLQPYGRGNGFGAVIKYGGDYLTLESFIVNNGKMGAGFGCQQGKDNAQFDLRGTGTVIRDSKMQFVIAPADVSIINSQIECSLKKTDDPSAVMNLNLFNRKKGFIITGERASGNGRPNEQSFPATASGKTNHNRTSTSNKHI